jgi:hypothetical protein
MRPSQHPPERPNQKGRKTVSLRISAIALDLDVPTVPVRYMNEM